MGTLNRLSRHEPKRKQFEGNLDYTGLGDLIYTLLQTVWGKGWGKFIMINPKTLDPKNVDFPVITFDMIEQSPGVVGQNNVRERKPRRRDTIKDFDDNIGEEITVQIDGQVIDAKIQFCVFAETNLEAIELSEGFMSVLHQYKGLLQKHGLRNIWFNKEEYDDGRPQDSINVRKITYDVTFEKLYRIVEGEIKEINIETEVLMKELRKEGKLPSQDENYKEDYK